MGWQWDDVNMLEIGKKRCVDAPGVLMKCWVFTSIFIYLNN